MPVNDFQHKFIPSQNVNQPHALLLLHGTGGDENSMLEIGEAIGHGSALLSPQGKSHEEGYPRFFRRFAEGVLDEVDVRNRANELALWVAEACESYKISPGALIAVGYSNGANMAAALLLLFPQLMAGAVLFRPMVPLETLGVTDLQQKKVLILPGESDHITPPEGARRLAQMMVDHGAYVEENTIKSGHGLTTQDMQIARDFLLKF